MDLKPSHRRSSAASLLVFWVYFSNIYQTREGDERQKKDWVGNKIECWQTSRVSIFSSIYCSLTLDWPGGPPRAPGWRRGGGWPGTSASTARGAGTWQYFCYAYKYFCVLSTWLHGAAGGVLVLILEAVGEQHPHLCRYLVDIEWYCVGIELRPTMWSISALVTQSSRNSSRKKSEMSLNIFRLSSSRANLCRYCVGNE